MYTLIIVASYVIDPHVLEPQLWLSFTARLCKLHRWQKLCSLLTVCIFIRLNHAENKVSCRWLCVAPMSVFDCEQFFCYPTENKWHQDTSVNLVMLAILHFYALDVKTERYWRAKFWFWRMFPHLPTTFSFVMIDYTIIKF